MSCNLAGWTKSSSSLVIKLMERTWVTRPRGKSWVKSTLLSWQVFDEKRLPVELFTEAWIGPCFKPVVAQPLSRSKKMLAKTLSSARWTFQKIKKVKQYWEFCNTKNGAGFALNFVWSNFSAYRVKVALLCAYVRSSFAHQVFLDTIGASQVIWTFFCQLHEKCGRLCFWHSNY